MATKKLLGGLGSGGHGTHPAPPPPPPPPPSGATASDVVAIVNDACPCFNNDGSRIEKYTFGPAMAQVTKALKYGYTARQIASFCEGQISRYATTDVPAGPGGNGGTSYELGWNVECQEFGLVQSIPAQFPQKKTGTGTKPTSGGNVNPGAGPGVG